MPDNAYHLDPPFNRGWVYGKSWGQTPDQAWEYRDQAGPTTGDNVRQREKAFPDVDPNTGAVLSNQVVTCVAVENTTNAALVAGTEVTADGYTGMLDEYLQKDVPVGEIAWIVVNGPITTDFDAGTRSYYSDGGPA